MRSLPLVASGALPCGQFGIVAFDVRDHLLLDPDRLDALVAMVDLVRELVAPAELHIVSTGTFLALPAAADAKVVAPDGSIIAASRDKWGRLRIRPLLPGDYSVESANRKTDVYANYYDAGESDLIALATPSTPTTTSATEAQSATAPKQVQPMAALLIVFARDRDPARIGAAAAHRESMGDAPCLSAPSCCGCCSRHRSSSCRR